MKAHKDPIVRQLVDLAGLETAAAEAFVRSIRLYGISHLPNERSLAERRESLASFKIGMQRAIAVLDAAHADDLMALSAYASNRFPETLKTSRFPTPRHAELRAFLEQYVAAADLFAEPLPRPGRGREIDGSKYRPVMLCARLWREIVGEYPGKTPTSKFVQALHIVMPLFGLPVPDKLHDHVARAFRYNNFPPVKS